MLKKAICTALKQLYFITKITIARFKNELKLLDICIPHIPFVTGCVLQQNNEYTNQTVEYYNAAATAFQLSPLEFLVWHALVFACSNTEERRDYHYYAVSIADVSRAVKVQRETIRRALFVLHEKGLAKRLGDRWMFQTADMD